MQNHDKITKIPCVSVSCQNNGFMKQKSLYETSKEINRWNRWLQLFMTLLPQSSELDQRISWMDTYLKIVNNSINHPEIIDRWKEMEENNRNGQH